MVWWTSFEGTIAVSHITMCTTYTHFTHNNSFTFEDVCTNRSMDMHHLLLIGSIRHHLDTFTLLLSTININFRRSVHSIILYFNLPQEDSSLWMLLIIGCSLENTPYGTQQLQHYNFGWQTSIHKCSVMLLNGFTQRSFVAILPSI